jgi:hypothetical protein
MLYGVIRFVYWGWIDQMYITPTYFFSYHGFDWVKPFSQNGMYFLFFVMAFSALSIMLGFFYRVFCILFFLSFTYVELIDKSTYLNHYYFVSITAFLLCFLPAHRSFSLDVFFKIIKPVQKIPTWMRDTLKFQLTLVYFFAGIAKINYDWLFEAQPLSIWLQSRQDVPLIGSWLVLPWMAYFFSWFGMLYDLFIPFLLSNKKYRLIGFWLVIVFHVLTRVLFNIGMFPFIMIGATTIFFSDDFHEKIINFLKKVLCIPKKTYEYAQIVKSSLASKIVLGVLILHFCIQIFIPFRYLLYPGELFWTEQGYRFSWRVMLIEKMGSTTFLVGDKSFKGEIEIYPSEYLTWYQEKMMSTQPDMILQFSHFLKEKYTGKKMTVANNVFHFKNPTVRVNAFVTLNGRGHKQLINPNIDLASQPISWRNKSWILPLNE